MSQPSINPYGAVDLSALTAQSRKPSPQTGQASTGRVVVDVGEADFESVVVEQSMTVPVVIDLWAEWCGPCKQLSPVLERLASEYGGRWLLAKIDIDANPRISQAFGVQSIPAVFAVVKGQPVPLFQGALPEAQVRQYLDELLRVAEANGVTGTLSDGAAQDATEVEEQPHDPRFDEAYDAIERGDYDAAATAYRALLAETPADEDAKAGLAQVELLRRTKDLDPQAARAKAAENPSDVAAQCDVADLDVLGGHVEDAFVRLIDTVRATAADERESARRHLVELFEIVGSTDPRVVKARQSLASALF